MLLSSSGIDVQLVFTLGLQVLPCAERKEQGAAKKYLPCFILLYITELLGEEMCVVYVIHFLIITLAAADNSK